MRPYLALGIILLLACREDSVAPRLAADLQPSFSLSSDGWSAPVNLGTTINTTAGEMNATFSPDELSLYFTSDRPGGLGSTDIWVARRDCVSCPWHAPVNAGSPINGTGQDAGPRFSTMDTCSFSRAIELAWATSMSRDGTIPTTILLGDLQCFLVAT